MEVSQKIGSRIVGFELSLCEDINNLWHGNQNIDADISQERNLECQQM